MNQQNKTERWEDKCRYCGYSEKEIKSMEGTFYKTGEVKSDFIRNLLDKVRQEEKEFCKRLYIDGADWSEWGVSDERAGEKFEEEYTQALSRQEIEELKIKK